MHFCVLLLAVFTLPALSLALLYDVDFKEVCLGNEFSLPVYSTSRIVTFTPKSPPGQRRTILEKTSVKDPRFEWTTDRRLVLKEVTPSDEGQYSIMLHSDFAYEMVHLIVSECIRSYQVKYGENFQHRIPEDGFLLEFSPLGSPPASEPVLLWNRTDPEMSQGGRGWMQHNGEMWVARKVTPADQGNYTMRSKAGKLMSRSRLTVQGHTFNVIRFTKESVNLPLFVPVHNATLTFTPTRFPNDPKPRRGPVQLVRDGRVVDNDVHFLNRVSVEAMYGSLNEVVITGLSTKHAGVYDIRDRDGNLVSSTILNVIEKFAKWRAILKSFSVPSGMFLSLAGLILFMKHYPRCSLLKIICCLNGNNSRPANPPRINVQDYSPDVHQPSGSYTHPQQPGTPRKWSPKASPAHMGYTPVAVGVPLYPSNARAGNKEGTGLPDHMPAHPAPTTIGDSFLTEQNNSFSMPGASDCLHTSEDCVQFQIKKDRDRRSKVKADFSALPLDSETTEDSAVYTSDKLNFL